MESVSEALLRVVGVLNALLPGGLFTAFCLLAIDWRKAMPVIRAGGWLPLVLLGMMAAFVCSLVWPSPAIVLGMILVPNFLWQLGSAAVLLGVALTCAVLQARYGWAPPEIDLEPPAHVHHDDHDHGTAPEPIHPLAPAVGHVDEDAGEGA
jgi:hypothetical protein